MSDGGAAAAERADRDNDRTACSKSAGRMEAVGLAAAVSMLSPLVALTTFVGEERKVVPSARERQACRPAAEAIRPRAT